MTGILALNKRSDFDRLNVADTRHEAQDARDAGKTLNLVTDVLIGAAVLAAGGAAYYYFSSRDARQEQSSTSLQIAPAVGPEAAWMSFRGQF